MQSVKSGVRTTTCSKITPKTGVMPVFNFRGMVKNPFNGSREQVVYRDCVPDGSIDIQNMSTGELYKRSWNFICNNPPELQTKMRA